MPLPLCIARWGGACLSGRRASGWMRLPLQNLIVFSRALEDGGLGGGALTQASEQWRPPQCATPRCCWPGAEVTRPPRAPNPVSPPDGPAACGAALERDPSEGIRPTWVLLGEAKHFKASCDLERCTKSAFM